LNPRFGVRNWTLKLTALFLAILLWTAVRIEAPDRRSIPGVPVQIVLNDPNWTLIGAPDPTTVDVLFSGPMRALLPLIGQPPPLRIVLDEISNADTVLALSRDWVALPPESGVAVDELQPATIRLTFDKYESVLLPFEVSTLGVLDSTLSLASHPHVIPIRGRVRGPSRQLAQMSRILLRAFDLGTIDGSGRRSIGVDTLALPSGVDVETEDLVVEFAVEPRLVRTFVGIPVQVENNSGLVAEPASIDVTLRGAASLIEGMSPVDIVVVAQVPVDSVGAEGVNVGITVRNTPELVTAELHVNQVRIRPRPVGALP